MDLTDTRLLFENSIKDSEKIWFTSDLHFGHNKEFLYKPRGFNSITEHDETIISNFNSVVSNDDVLVILGDVMLGDNSYGIKCLNRLNGHKFIIRGNHDTDKRWAEYAELSNAWLLDLVLVEKIRGYLCYLSHYPTATSNFDADKPLKQQLLNLSGHTHCKEKFNNLTGSYNVALDAHNNFPVEFNTIISDVKERLEDGK